MMQKLLNALKHNLISPDVEERVGAECVRLMFSNARLMLLSLAIITGITFYVFHGTVSSELLLFWVFCMFVMITIRLALTAVFKYINPPDHEMRRWGNYFTLTAILSGWLWCMVIVLFFEPANYAQKTYLVCILLGMTAGSMSYTSSWIPVHFHFVLPILITLNIYLFRQGGPEWMGLGFLEIIFTISLVRLGSHHYQTVTQTFRLQSQNIDLIDKLREQKNRAEQANSSKTQFLASASHDLRQPVHALALFANALDNEVHTEKGRELIGKLSRSVESIDELLTSLLDISKLDAGAVKVNTSNIALQPILNKIANEFSATAENRGLQLRIRNCDLAVYSDPVLLGNIVRNLVSNALRYTRFGGVLVACRTKGDMVSIEIWDSGIGIPQSEQEQIFTEFYQLNNPERDRGKGLGLGLAICHRICKLLGHKLELRSKPKRGSVFKITVPRSKVNIQASASELETTNNKTYEALILVIDDETEILSAMDAVLKSWGCKVITASSGDEAVNELSQDPKRIPDLIVCDYRLRDSETGTNVIRMLHRILNKKIPAIIMSGDTAPESIRDAQASGHTLLHKPVKPMEFQRTLTQLLSNRAA